MASRWDEPNQNGSKTVKLIKFTTDKNGNKLAYSWGVSRRWFRMSIEVAEMEIALGLAAEIQE